MLQAIAKPFEKLERVQRVKRTLSLAWVGAGGVAILCLTSNSLATDNENQDSLQDYHFNFLFYVFSPVIMASVAAILGFYISILYLMRKHTLVTARSLGRNNKVKPEVTVSSVTRQNRDVTDQDTTSAAAVLKLGHSKGTPSYNTHASGSDQTANGRNQGSETIFQGVSDGSVARTSGVKVSSVGDKLTTIKQTVERGHEKTNLIQVKDNVTNKDDVPGCEHSNRNSRVPTVPGGSTAQHSISDLQLPESQFGARPPNGATTLQTHVIDVCDVDGRQRQLKTDRDDVVGAICVMTNKNKENGKRRVEARMAKITAAVITAFLICWLPFPASIFYSYAGDWNTCSKNSMFLLATSLAFLTTVVNPLIYGLMNKQFRNQLVKLLKFCKQRLRMK